MLTHGSFCVVQSPQSWAGAWRTRPSVSCSRHHQHRYVSESPDLDVSLLIPLGLGLSPVLMPLIVAFVIVSSNPSKSWAPTMSFFFSRFSLSVGYSVQTTYKTKSKLSRSPWALASVQLAGSLCPPPSPPSSPTLTALMPLLMCLEAIRSNLILSFIPVGTGSHKKFRLPRVIPHLLTLLLTRVTCHLISECSWCSPALFF